jgi:superfamily II DNA or RNA helicase
MNKRVITGDAIEHWRKHAEGRATVCFCINIKHAEDVAAQFRESGIRAKAVHGKMPLAESQKILDELRTGEITVITSCDLISEGVDVPRLEAAILLRPTQSLIVYLQQVGRCLRVLYADGYDLSTREGRLSAIKAGPKQNAIILDHAGNCFKHDLPAAKREWTLEDIDKKKRKKSEAPALKTCPQCFAIHAPAPACPVCEHVYDTAESKQREAKQEDGELEEIKAKSIKQYKWQRMREQSQCKSYEELVQLARARGYEKPEGWARIIWSARSKRAFATGAQR